MGGLPVVGGSIPSVSTQDAINLLPPSVIQLKGQIEVGIQSNPQAVGGAVAAYDLVTGGFTGSQADNAKIVHVMSGAVSLVPGIGPLLGAIVEGMYALGNAIAGPLDKLLGNCTDPNGCCTSTGTWTYQMVLSASNASPPLSTFAALAVPVLAQNLIDQLSCKSSLARDPYNLLMPGLVSQWNLIASGPPVELFMPLLTEWGRSQQFAGSFEPKSTIWNNYPAVGTLDSIFVYPAQGPYAFMPLSQVPARDRAGSSVADPTQEGFTWSRLVVNGGPPQDPGASARYEAAAALALGTQIATGLQALKQSGIPLAQWNALAPAQQQQFLAAGFFVQGHGAPKPPMSTPAKVAIGTAAVAGTAAVGIGVWAWLTHQALGVAFGKAWDATGGKLVSGASHVLRRNPVLGLLPSAAMLMAGEGPTSMTVQTLLFPRSRFTPSKAKRWAKSHGYKYGKTHTTRGYVRIRQMNPGRLKTMRTIPFGDSGVKAVVGR